MSSFADFAKHIDRSVLHLFVVCRQRCYQGRNNVFELCWVQSIQDVGSGDLGVPFNLQCVEQRGDGRRTEMLERFACPPRADWTAFMPQCLG